MSTRLLLSASMVVKLSFCVGAAFNCGCAVVVRQTETYAPVNIDLANVQLRIRIENRPFGIRFFPPVPILIGYAYGKNPYETWIYVSGWGESLRRVNMLTVTVMGHGLGKEITVVDAETAINRSWNKARQVDPEDRSSRCRREAVFRSKLWGEAILPPDTLRMAICFEADMDGTITTIREDAVLRLERKKDLAFITLNY